MIEIVLAVWLVPTVLLAAVSLFSGLICVLCAYVSGDDPEDDDFVRVYARGLIYCWAWPYGIVVALVRAYRITRKDR